MQGLWRQMKVVRAGHTLVVVVNPLSYALLKVRMAASVATRQFLSNMKETTRERFLPQLAPRLCLNRCEGGGGGMWTRIDGNSSRNQKEPTDSLRLAFVLTARLLSPPYPGTMWPKASASTRRTRGSCCLAITAVRLWSGTLMTRYALTCYILIPVPACLYCCFH